MSFSETQIALAWRDALALWEAEVTLSAPQPLERQGQGDWGGDEPLAYIDMVRRQVVVNYELLERIGAAKSLTAVYAHELGHHLRFPHTLGLSASLELLQKRLLPGSPSLTNLFFDLQVNEYVGRTRQDELSAVYQGFNRMQPGPSSPLFAYYLAVYEELWNRPDAELTLGSAGMMDEKFPGWRADARMFAQTFYALTDTYLQFVYFCSRVIRYLPEPGQQLGKLPFAGDLPTPDLDDYAGALEGNGAVDRALQEGAERGWLDQSQSGTEEDPLEDSAAADGRSRLGGDPVPASAGGAHLQAARRALPREAARHRARGAGSISAHHDRGLGAGREPAQHRLDAVHPRGRRHGRAQPAPARAGARDAE